ncbi:MAG: cytochrome P450 [Cyanobacteria bacterium J06638_6]
MNSHPQPTLDLNDPLLKEDPYSVYRTYRETQPVVWSEPLKAWVFFKYEDVNALLNDPRSSANRAQSYLDRSPASRQAAIQPIIEIISRWILFLDGSDHIRLRKLVNHGFTQEVVAGLRPVIAEVVRELLDGLADRPQFDASTEFAYLVPVRVIADMLCVPPADHSSFQHWSDDTARFITSAPITEAACDRALASMQEMIAHLKAIVAERKAHPQDDFLSFLLQAEEAGEVLSAEDLLANLVLLLQAGHETTRNLIGNAVYQLLQRPQVLKQVQQNPALWGRVVDETLRYDSPVQIATRVALDDMTIGGQPIAQGQLLYLVLGSANHDESHFSRADEFLLDREVEHHLAFGSGPHYCVGHYLAKAEATIALEELFRRFPDLRLDPTMPKQWFDSTRFRGLQSLPVLNETAEA